VNPIVAAQHLDGNKRASSKFGIMQKRKEVIKDLVETARQYHLCSPSDDPEKHTDVTAGFYHLVVQFKRLVSPILSDEAAAGLNGINVQINDIYSCYEARAELDALLPEVEDAIEAMDEVGARPGANLFIVEPTLLSQLSELKSSRLDVTSLVRMCREINSSHSHGNVLATVLLMRTVLNHVPPAFGCDTFGQVSANVGKSLKESFNHLETGLRKVADFHAHRKIGTSEFYPSMAQVEPFKPQFELLLQQVLSCF
jgi:hypothetical protein